MSSTSRLCALFFVVTASLLTACGGVTTSAAPPGPTTVRQATATLRITVPTAAPLPLGAARSPRYLSPATKAIAISFTSTTQSSPPTLTFNQNLTVGSTGCTASFATPLVCNVVFALTPDTYTGTVTTYDQVLNGTTPQGNVLSSRQSFTVTIAANTANSINVILGGVPTGALFIPSPTSSLTGGPTAFAMYNNVGAQQVSVVATDADANIILGPGAPTITLASSDPTFTPAVIDATLNPNAFSLTPSGTNPSTVTLTATITPASGGGTAITRTFPITLNGPLGVSTLAGSTTGSTGFANGVGTTALFSGPREIAINSSGNLIVADGSLYRQVTPGGIVTTFNANTFTNASGVAIDGSGNVYVSQVNVATVMKIATNGTVTTYGTIGTGGNINGIACDSAGNVYAADAGNGSLWEIAASGTVTQIVTNSFILPTGIALDSANGFLYIGDSSGSIHKVSTAGGSATTFVSSVGTIRGLAIANGYLYFTDATANLVRKTPLTGGSAGTPTTIAGSGTAGNTDSTSPLSATFNVPWGIAVSSDGTTLYLTDYFGNNIRVIRGNS